MLLRFLLPAALTALLGLAGCTLATDTGYPVEETCASDAPMVRTELFFGLDRFEEPPVTEAEWQEFVDAEVTPRFSEGLTMLSSDGQYLAESGEQIHEDSKIVILLHDGSPAASADVDAIRQAYLERFDQESVLRVDSDACVGF
jgi:hypothetical protein